MKKQVFQCLKKITIAALLALVAYILLSGIMMSIISGIGSERFKLAIIAVGAAIAYAYILFYLQKVCCGAVEEEIMADYKEKRYVSLIDDIKMSIRREKLLLLTVGGVMLLCLLLNTFDSVALERKLLSNITFIYVAMCLCATFLPPAVSFLGYFIGYGVIVIFYLLFLSFARRKQYKYWLTI